LFHFLAPIVVGSVWWLLYVSLVVSLFSYGIKYPTNHQENPCYNRPKVIELTEPFDEQTSEKLNEIADCLNLLAQFVIDEARYARINNQQIV